jgi:hypothetical protein
LRGIITRKDVCVTNANPWLTAPTTRPNPPSSPPPELSTHHGATAPQASVPTPDTADRLPRKQTEQTATVWWLGTHGGAGESTLAGLAAKTRAASHAWPVPSPHTGPHRVVLVARTNYAGLLSAQRAATEWASGSLDEGVELIGLVLIADAPGRLPKPLRDYAQLIAGGVPRLWHLPWIDSWRLGPAIAGVVATKAFLGLFADLSLTAHSTAE